MKETYYLPRELPRVTPPEPVAPTRRSCNRHSDCDAADAERAANPIWLDHQGRICAPGEGTKFDRADHCHDECCEECFGN